MSDWARDDLIYLAGLLDGEGCFTPGDSGRVQVTMTDEATIHWLHREFGGSKGVQEDLREPHYKPQWHWTLSKQSDVVELIAAVLPFLYVKYLEAEALLALVRHCEAKPDYVSGGPRGSASQGPEWDEWRDRRTALQQRVKDMRTAEHVLAVDPGERVGWARAAITADGQVHVLAHGISPLKDFALTLHKAARRYTVLLYEQYRIYAHLAKQHIGSDIPTAQFVGMVKLCAWLNPKVKLVSQGASCMKTGEKVAPPAIAEVLARLPKSHDESHDGSALRHLSFYWFKNYVG